MPLFAQPVIVWTAAVTILALLYIVAAAINVSRARRTYRLPPPILTGDAAFERVVRVHANGIEALALFLPALWLAAIYFRALPWLAPLIGLVWVVGRIVYWTGYSRSSDGRLPGFVISMLSTLALIVLAIIGVIDVWATNSASM